MVKRYGDDAMVEAAARADQLTEDGDWEGANDWHRILDAIEQLQVKAPADGEAVHDRHQRVTRSGYGRSLP